MDTHQINTMQPSSSFVDDGSKHEEETFEEHHKRKPIVVDHNEAVPDFDPAVERRIRLKTDFRLVPMVALLYLFCFIDRSNIGNARLAGFEKDLGLKGYDFNTVLSVFYVSYLLFEIPANLCCKYFGPGRWLPFLTLMFGILTIAFAFIHNRAQAIGVRFLLGIFESGMLPGISYYLSRWYRKSELTFRLGLFIVTAPLAGAFGGLLASGILKISHIGSVHSWALIFLIEGIVTCALAIMSWFILTDRPEKARWLTPEERIVAVERVKSENVATTVVLDKMDTAKVWRGILNPNSISVAFIFAFLSVPANSVAVFAPTIIKGLYPGKSTIQQQLLTVPPYVVGAAVVLSVCLASSLLNKRMVFMVGLVPFLIMGYIILLATLNIKARYAAVFFLASAVFPFGALTNAQAAANTVSDTARSSAIATNVMIGSLGSLAATWSYLPGDAPAYRRGSAGNMVCSVILLVIGICLWIWEKRDNARRDRVQAEEELKLEKMTQKEIEDLDWKHPGFRWKM